MKVTLPGRHDIGTVGARRATGGQPTGWRGGRAPPLSMTPKALQRQHGAARRELRQTRGL